MHDNQTYPVDGQFMQSQLVIFTVIICGIALVPISGIDEN